MTGTLGNFLVSVLLLILGIFLMIAAYSQKPLLLKLTGLGMINIHPDSPGRRQRAIVFYVGVAFCLVGLILILVQRLIELKLIHV
jgi:hypothetical protein